MSPSNLKISQRGVRGLAFALGVMGCLSDLHARKPSAAEDACLADTVCVGLYEEARRLSKSGDFATALAAYQGAYRRQAVPWLLINIGRTLHKLGRPADALVQYRRYLGDEPSGPADRLQTVNDYIAQAEKAVAEKAQGVPPIKPADPSSGKPDGKAPDAGTDGSGEKPKDPPAVSGSDPGGEPPPGPAVVALTPPSAAGSTVGLGKEPTQPTGATAAPGTSSGSVAVSQPSGTSGSSDPAVTPRSDPAVTSPSDNRPRRPLPSYFWVGLGVGGGLMLAGAATGIAALVDARSLSDTPYAGLAPTQLLDQQSRVRGLSVSSDVLLGVGAATVGVVTVIMLVGRYGKSQGPK